MAGWEGFVLTGGASSRMGRDKALLPVGGVPMAARVARALAGAGAVTVTCVGGDRAGLTAAGLTAVADDAAGEGPLGGLLTALDRAGEGFVVVLACDLLAPDAATVRTVVETLEAHPAADAAMPVFDGRRQVLHAAWRSRAAAELHAAWDRGERSVRRASAGLVVVEVAGIDPATQFDADTPADLPPRRPGA